MSQSRESPEHKTQSNVSQLQYNRQAGHHAEFRDFAPSNFRLSHIWCLIQPDPAAFLSISSQVFLLMLFLVGEKQCARNLGWGGAQGCPVQRWRD